MKKDFVKGLLNQDHNKRLGSGPSGINEILDHPYWHGVEWDLVPLKKFESPCLGVKAPAKRKKDKENLAVQIASDIAEAGSEEQDEEYNVANWDFVSPTAVVEMRVVAVAGSGGSSRVVPGVNAGADATPSEP